MEECKLAEEGGGDAVSSYDTLVRGEQAGERERAPTTYHATTRLLQNKIFLWGYKIRVPTCLLMTFLEICMLF
jgi:hypothetical protein